MSGFSGYTGVFGNGQIQPTESAYRALTFSENQQLTWAFSLEDTSNPTAKLMDISTSVAGLQIAMPNAQQASVGEQIVFNNVGSEDILITSIDGGTLRLIPPSSSIVLYLLNNDTDSGSWRIITFGSVTSYSDASVLAGYGIKAIGATLNQNYKVYLEAVSFTADATYRASIRVWTGGAGIATLPSASSVQDGFFFWVRNGGTGLLTVNPSGGDVINRSRPNHPMLPRESAMFVSSGGQWYTVADTPPGAFELVENGPYVPLGPDGKIPDQYIPALAITDIFTVANQAEMLALNAQRGDFAIRTDIRTTFGLSQDAPGVLSAWKEIVGPYIKTVFGVTPAPGTTVSISDMPAYPSTAVQATDLIPVQSGSTHYKATLTQLLKTITDTVATLTSNSIKTVFGVTPGPSSQTVSIPDIPALEGAIDNADSIPIYDASTSTHRRATIATLLGGLTTVISGLPRKFIELTDTPDNYSGTSLAGNLLFSRDNRIDYTGGSTNASWNGSRLGIANGSLGASGGDGITCFAGGTLSDGSQPMNFQNVAGFAVAQSADPGRNWVAGYADVGVLKCKITLDGVYYGTNLSIQAADYAEWFEGARDLVPGLSVVIGDNGVRPFDPSTDAPGDIIGVTRPRDTRAALIGNTAEAHWAGMYLTDDFGAPVWTEARDVDGRVYQTQALNPAYDPSQTYIPRSQRPEWSLVGLLGQIPLRRGCIAHPSWFFIRHISDDADLYLVRGS